MARMFGVQFRGREHDIEVTYDGGPEPDTGAHDIEWDFVDKGIGRDMTADEEQQVLDQIYAVLNDLHAYEDTEL